MAKLDLNPDETLVAQWRPRVGIYLSKILFIAAIWALITGPIKFPTPWVWLATVGASLVIYLVMFDDFQEWFRHRKDQWTLTNQRLIFFNATSLDTPVSLDLCYITKIRLWMFWAVHIRISNGQTTTLTFVPNRTEIRDKITQTIAMKKDENHGQ